MFSPGGIIFSLMPKKFRQRNLFEHCLYLYQRLFLFLKFRSLSKIQKQTLARCSHIQLAIGDGPKSGTILFLSITFPTARFEVYDDIRLANEPENYYEKPLFSLNNIQIAKLADFATDLISPQKRLYDWLQLFSYVLNMGIWIVKPSTWGREICHTLNLPGDKQVCSSGVAACLRYAEVGPVSQSLIKGAFETQEVNQKIKFLASRSTSNFFVGYNTAMVSPVVFLLENKWETPGEIYQID